MANYNNIGSKSIFTKKTTTILLILVPASIVALIVFLKFA